jgi:hypothetical protein
MKKAIVAGLAGLMALGTLGSPAAAQVSGAQLAAPVAAASSNASAVEDVQYRRYRERHHSRRYYNDRRYYGDRRYYRHRDRSNIGVGVAAGVLGLAAGAALANSANASSRNSDGVQYCINRFRSYDVRSGTYLGYDGRRHACP